MINRGSQKKIGVALLQEVARSHGDAPDEDDEGPPPLRAQLMRLSLPFFGAHVVTKSRHVAAWITW